MNPTAVPDDDPLDNCSSSSHGTHVAGIVAANGTSMSQTGFIPIVPFVGVAPDATLGACKHKFDILSYHRFYFPFQIVYLDVMQTQLVQVRSQKQIFCVNFKRNNLLNKFVDMITAAIYKAFDDKADISE